MIKCLNGIITYLCLKISYIHLCLIILVSICIRTINNMLGLAPYTGVYTAPPIGGQFAL